MSGPTLTVCVGSSSTSIRSRTGKRPVLVTDDPAAVEAELARGGRVVVELATMNPVDRLRFLALARRHGAYTELDVTGVAEVAPHEVNRIRGEGWRRVRLTGGAR